MEDVAQMRGEVGTPLVEKTSNSFIIHSDRRKEAPRGTGPAF